MARIWVIDEDREEAAWIRRVAGAFGHVIRVFPAACGLSAALAADPPDVAFVSAGKQGERTEGRLRILEAAGFELERVLLVAGGLQAGPLRGRHGHRLAAVLKRPLGLEDLVRHLEPLTQEKPHAGPR